MKAYAKRLLLVVILTSLLLCTTVASTTSCESAFGTGALIGGVIVVIYVAYWVGYAFSTPSYSATSSTNVDPRLALISSDLPKLIEQRQDLVIRNELDCSYQVYVDGEYRGDVGPLSAISLTVGVGSHDATLLRLDEASRELETPSELHRRFEVVDEQGFAYAVIQYSY